MHTSYDGEYPMSQANHYNGSYPDKLHDLGSDDDVEGRDEKKKLSGDKCVMRYSSQVVRLIGLSASLSSPSRF
jgi:hypothetical protein